MPLAGICSFQHIGSKFLRERNSVATTPTSAPRNIKEVLRITATTDRDQWEHRPCGAAGVQDQELPIAAKWAGVNQADKLAAPQPQGVRLDVRF